jgi:hypothetical protein
MSSFLAQLGKHKIIKDGRDLAGLQPTGIFSIDLETHGKPVGDCPYNPAHGICGVSLCNFVGDAVYVVINDGRDYGGVDIEYFIDFMNTNWFVENAVSVFHNCKFDLGFLLNRGLDISKIRIHDTYIIRTILRRGIYVSNALKDIAKELFGITVDSQDVIKNWLKANNTQDYGDIPIETMAPYACDDVRYTLALMTHDHDIGSITGLHDGARIKKLELQLKEKTGTLKELMNGAELDINDDQAVLAYLHNRNMHPGPRQQYGEAKYVLDTEFLASVEHELSKTYMMFARKKKFVEQFSGANLMNGRQFKNSTDAGYHPSFFPSTFSRGAIPNCKLPDFNESVKLIEPIRNTFIPREGHKFIAIKAQDLPAQLLAWYCQDQKILEAVGEGGELTCQAYSNRNALGIPANSLLLRRILEGSGYAVLERRMKIAGIQGANKNANYAIHNEFEASLVGYSSTLQNLNNAAKDGAIKDRCGREIIIPENKHYRSHAILINSSMGNIFSTYMDALCRCMNKTEGHLVMAHERELLFEVNENNDLAAVLAAKVLKSPLADPIPKFILREGRGKTPWTMPVSDAHEVMTDRWM